MVKLFFLLLSFSINVIASDHDHPKKAPDKESGASGADFSCRARSSFSISDKLSTEFVEDDTLLRKRERQEILFSQHSRKLRTPPWAQFSDPPPPPGPFLPELKEASQESETIDFDNLIYVDFLTDAELELYLDQLDQIPRQKSSNHSFSLLNEEAPLSAFIQFEKTFLEPFIPLFEKILMTVLARLTPDQTLSHMAIRVDLDMRMARRDRSRAQTSLWHNHERDNYLFTLTRKPTLATDIQVKKGDDNCFETNMDSNRLMLLPKLTMHKTPRSRDGRRIQLNIGVDPKSKYLELITAEPSQSTPR